MADATFSFEPLRRGASAVPGRTFDVQQDGAFMLLRRASSGGAQRGLVQEFVPRASFPALPDVTADALFDQWGQLAGRELAAAIARWEAEHRGPAGLVRYVGGGAFSKEVLSAAEAAELGGAKAGVVVLLHGTFASPEASFCEIPDARLGAWSETHDVVALRMHTIGTSPVQQAVDLLRLLPTGPRITVISHSRGGIVGELIALASVPDSVDLAAADPAWSELAQLCGAPRTWHHHIRVGSPQVGTPLAGERLDAWVSVWLYLLGRLIASSAGQALATWSFSRSALVGVLAAVRDPESLPGLSCMDPAGFVARMLREGTSKWLNRTVVAGESGWQGLSLPGLLARTVGELFFEGANDLVVPVHSMKAGPVGGTEVVLDIRSSGIHHLNYFSQPHLGDLLAEPWVPPTRTLRGDPRPDQRFVLVSERDDAFVWYLHDVLAGRGLVKRLAKDAGGFLDWTWVTVGVTLSEKPKTWLDVRPPAGDNGGKKRSGSDNICRMNVEDDQLAAAVSALAWLDAPSGHVVVAGSEGKPSSYAGALSGAQPGPVAPRSGRVKVSHTDLSPNGAWDTAIVLPWFSGSVPEMVHRLPPKQKKVVLHKLANDTVTGAVGSTDELGGGRGLFLLVGLGDPQAGFDGRRRAGIFNAVSQAVLRVDTLKVPLPTPQVVAAIGLGVLIDTFLDAWVEACRSSVRFLSLEFVTPWRDQAQDAWHHLNRSALVDSPIRRFDLYPHVTPGSAYRGRHTYVPPTPPMRVVQVVGSKFSVFDGPRSDRYNLKNSGRGRTVDLARMPDPEACLTDPEGWLRELLPQEERHTLEAAGLELILDRAWSAVPWETLSLAGGAIGLRSVVTRRLSRGAPMLRSPEVSRTALVVANPTGDLPGAEAEGEAVCQALQRAGYEVQLVGARQGVRGRELLHLVLRPWRVLHIATHGDEEGRLLLGRDEDGVMVLLDEAWVSHCQAPPSIAVLSCCFSGSLGGKVNLRSFAEGLLPSGTHAMVGTAWAIDDRHAVTFSTTLYGELVRGAPIGVASRLARLAVEAGGGSGRDWGAWQVWGDATYALRGVMHAEDVFDLSTPEEVVDAAMTARGLVEVGNQEAAVRLLERVSAVPWLEASRGFDIVGRAAAWGAVGMAWRFAGREDLALECLERMEQRAWGGELVGAESNTWGHLHEIRWMNAVLASQAEGLSDRARGALRGEAAKALATLCFLAETVGCDVARLAMWTEACRGQDPVLLERARALAPRFAPKSWVRTSSLALALEGKRPPRKPISVQAAEDDGDEAARWSSIKTRGFEPGLRWLLFGDLRPGTTQDEFVERFGTDPLVIRRLRVAFILLHKANVARPS